MRHSTSSSAKSRLGFYRWSVVTIVGLGLVVAFAGCKPKPRSLSQPTLYLGTSVPGIEIFNVTLNPSGVPQMIRQSGIPVAAGAVMAMTVIDKSLYAAAGGGSIAQFTIDPLHGGLTLRGTIPAGSPPYSMAATAKNVYVANRGSNNLSVYSIDAAGNLASLQTVTSNGVNSLQLDSAGKFLFTGSRTNGATGPQVCTHLLQPDGSLPATPSCVAVNGAPQEMQFTGGVLFLLFNATVAPALGVTNWVSAWTVDPATGALTHRGTDLDIGAANTVGMAVSTNGQTLFLPRQGGFLTVGTANPLSARSITFTPTFSQWCLLPPVGPGQVLVDPRGKALYITDPIGAVAGNIIGPRVASLEITAGGGLNPIICDAAGSKPMSMALFIP